MRGMANRCDPLINVVTENKRKVLGCFDVRNSKSPARANTLGPKGKGSGMSAPNSLIADGVPPAERRGLTHAVRVLARNVVSL